IQQLSGARLLGAIRGAAERLNRVEHDYVRELCVQLVDRVVVGSQPSLHRLPRHHWGALAPRNPDGPQETGGLAFEYPVLAHVDAVSLPGMRLGRRTQPRLELKCAAGTHRTGLALFTNALTVDVERTAANQHHHPRFQSPDMAHECCPRLITTGTVVIGDLEM